ncbi:unnamed protein product [Rhizophagus irregularis]|nr:unnamed protein product [Rhizophagus irregularis]
MSESFQLLICLILDQIRNKIKCQKFTHWIIRNLSPDSPLYPTSTDICNIKEYESIINNKKGFLTTQLNLELFVTTY